MSLQDELLNAEFLEASTRDVLAPVLHGTDRAYDCSLAAEWYFYREPDTFLNPLDYPRVAFSYAHPQLWTWSLPDEDPADIENGEDLNSLAVRSYIVTTCYPPSLSEESPQELDQDPPDFFSFQVEYAQSLPEGLRARWRSARSWSDLFIDRFSPDELAWFERYFATQHRTSLETWHAGLHYATTQKWPEQTAALWSALGDHIWIWQSWSFWQTPDRTVFLGSLVRPLLDDRRWVHTAMISDPENPEAHGDDPSVILTAPPQILALEDSPDVTLLPGYQTTMPVCLTAYWLDQQAIVIDPDDPTQFKWAFPIPPNTPSAIREAAEWWRRLGHGGTRGGR